MRNTGCRNGMKVCGLSACCAKQNVLNTGKALNKKNIQHFPKERKQEAGVIQKLVSSNFLFDNDTTAFDS